MADDIIELLLDTLKKGENSKKSVLDILTDLQVKTCEQGLSNNNLKSLINALLHSEVDCALFQKFVLCLIPKEDVEPEIIKDLLTWIILFYRKIDEMKIDSLLFWIAGLVDYHLINKEVLDDYYNLIFAMLEYNPQPVCHLIYLLTKPDDVQRWRVMKLQELFKKLGPKKYLKAVIQLFKKYNPAEVDFDASNEKSEEPFARETAFYKTVRSSLKRVSVRMAVTDYTHATVIAEVNKQLKTLVPVMKYSENAPDDIELKLHNIKSGEELGKHFTTIALPNEVLSLLQTKASICLLSFCSPSLQQRFFCRLFASLEEGFILNKENITDTDREDILLKVIELQRFSLQGFKSVSKFLNLYLKSWNGISFRKHVYRLLEWYTFDSLQELNRNVFLPLHMLFVSSRPRNMSEIIQCLTGFVVNLYLYLERERDGIDPLFKDECNIGSHLIVPALESVSRFVANFCDIGLYVHPCNCTLLTTIIMFYEKVFCLERVHNLNMWSMPPSTVTYHSLFCSNAEVLNQWCRFFNNFEQAKNGLTYELLPKLQNTFSLAECFYRDVCNALWRSTLFEERDRGYVFSDITRSDTKQWYQFVNLDAVFDIRHHMMFQPHRLKAIAEGGNTRKKFEDKKEMLEMLKAVAPDIVKFIAYINDNAENSFNTSGLY